MNDAHKEEMGENRMLLPAITTGVGVGHHSYPPPMQFELLPGQERPTTGGAATTTRHDAPKDAGLDLEPTAMAALRAALAGKSHVETAPGLPPSVARPEGVAPIPEWRGDRRVPVLKTSTGTFLVGPTPQPSPQGHRSFPSRPVMPPRLMPNPPQPPSAHGAPHLRDQQLLFTTPEPRINVQSTARGAMPPVSKSPVSTYLVQASTGMYCIMSGGEATRSAEGRMMPMELKPHHHPHAHHHHHHHPQQQHGLPMTQQSNATEARPMLPLPNPPSHPPMFAKAVKTSVSLTSKLQASALARPMQPQMQMQQQHQQQRQQQHHHHHHHHQQLSQKLLERPGNAAAAAAFMEPFSATGNLEAAAENLKSLFLSDNSHLPAPPLENLNFNPVPQQPFSDFFTERSTVSHKRRKTSTPASLDDLPPPSLSASQQAGLELLLQAAKTVGDTLPLNCDLHSRRSSYRKRTVDDRPSAPRLEYSLDPALRHCYGVLDNFTGVYPLVNGSFVARIRFKGCYALIGTFKTAEDAARAYDRVVLTFRGRKARTNYPYADYLTFELTNAKRAFEAKFKQCERTRRGSIWPWARAAHTLLANDEEGNDDVVPELRHPASPLTGTISGESVFELLQNVMLKRKDLNGTFDLIQAKIRQLQTRIQSGMSTEEECDCVGQYASAANILRSLVTMQNEWERKQNRKSGSRGVVLEERTPLRIHTDEDEEDEDEDEDEEEEDTTSETKQVTPFQGDMLQNTESVYEGDRHPQHPELNSSCPLPKEPSSLGDEQQSRCTVLPQKHELPCPYTESIRWVRLLASSLWPRKRGGGMLWKAYQPLFKSNHHRRSILQLREELFVKPESLGDHISKDQ